MSVGDTEHACGKSSWPTRALAKDALRAFTRARGSKGMRVYRCERCSLWHMGRGHRSKKWKRSRENGGAGAPVRSTDVVG